MTTKTHLSSPKLTREDSIMLTLTLIIVLGMLTAEALENLANWLARRRQRR